MRIAKKKAVALRYNEESDHAPKVTAKGEEYFAEEIIATAESAGVPLYEDDALVEILAQIELDREIPPELYGAVAEMFTWIYKANREL